MAGRECQKWTSQTPHEHSVTPENFPDGGLGDHNFCRDADGEIAGAWCYTMDPGWRWEYCSCRHHESSGKNRPGQWFNENGHQQSLPFICSAPLGSVYRDDDSSLNESSNNDVTDNRGYFCPSDWFEFHGSCYKFVYQMYSADDATEKCKSIGAQIGGEFGRFEGYLATIQVILNSLSPW